jgi:stringent starvation protein B
MAKEGIEFRGRFGGIPTRVYVPTAAILGIYARENGQGMIFEVDDSNPDPPTPVERDFKPVEISSGQSSGQGKGKPKSRPSLRVVK